jgi:probable rRNA maturation factor
MGADGSGPPRTRRPGLTVVVGDARGRPVRAPGLSLWLRAIAPARVRGRVGIALVSDRRVQLLNRTYRRLDHPTDVLSFPAVEQHRSAPAGARGRDGWLGEIVIARGVARRQARSAGHSELTELRVLALHGLLHLLGYDHETDAGEMRRVEARLRRKGGLPGGLIERTR